MHSMRVLAIAAGLAVLSCAAFSDTLVVRRGDTFHGDLREIAEGTVLFQTHLAGQVIVPVRRVTALTTKSTFRVMLKESEDPVYGKFSKSPEHPFLISSSHHGDRPLNLSDIARAEPAVEPKPKQEDTPEWGGGFETGYLTRYGNLDYGAPFARLKLRREGEAYYVFSDAMLELAREGSFPRMYWLDTEWRFLHDGNLKPTAALELERDIDNALNFRGALSLGVTRGLVDDEERRLDAGVALNAAFEYYDTEPLWREAGGELGRLRERSILSGLLSPSSVNGLRRIRSLVYYADEYERAERQEMGLRLRLDFAQLFARGVLFSEDLRLYPSLTDLGEARARSESALLLPLTQQLKLKLNVNVDYDSEPEFSVLDNWRATIGASIMWDF